VRLFRGWMIGCVATVSLAALAEERLLYLASGTHNSPDGCFSLAAIEDGEAPIYRIVSLQNGVFRSVSDDIAWVDDRALDRQGYGPARSLWSVNSRIQNPDTNFPIVGDWVAVEFLYRKSAGLEVLVRKDKFYELSRFELGEFRGALQSEILAQLKKDPNFGEGVQLKVDHEFGTSVYRAFDGSYAAVAATEFDVSEGLLYRLEGFAEIAGAAVSKGYGVEYSFVLKLKLGADAPDVVATFVEKNFKVGAKPALENTVER